MSAKATATFEANDSPIQAAFRRVDKQLLGLEKKFAVVAKSAALLFAGPAAAATALGVGILKAVDAGAELRVLSDRTGVAAGDLLKLQQEFKLSGVSADDLGVTLNKMQKNIATGAANSTLAKLGVNLQNLKKQNPSDQFHAIGAAAGHEGANVLRQAATAESEAGIEKSASDARVMPERISE